MADNHNFAQECERGGELGFRDARESPMPMAQQKVLPSGCPRRSALAALDGLAERWRILKTSFAPRLSRGVSRDEPGFSSPVQLSVGFWVGSTMVGQLPHQVGPPPTLSSHS